MAKRRKTITPAMAKRHWGKHYGVGFMSSIGFKCERISEDLYEVVKHTYGTGGHVLSSASVGRSNKSNLMKLAMDNGFNPRHEMESEGPDNFQYMYNAGTGKPNKTGYLERTVNTLKK